MISSNSWVDFVEAIEKAGKKGYKTSLGQPITADYYNYRVLMERPLKEKVHI